MLLFCYRQTQKRICYSLPTLWSILGVQHIFSNFSCGGHRTTYPRIQLLILHKVAVPFVKIDLLLLPVLLSPLVSVSTLTPVELWRLRQVSS